MFTCFSHDEKTVRNVGTRQCFTSLCTVVVFQASLLCTSALAMLSSCHLIGGYSDAVGGVVISAAAYTVLIIMANNVVLACANSSRTGPWMRSKALLGYLRLYAVTLIIVWALTFVFELVMDVSLDEAIWTDAGLLPWELMRIISGGLSLVLSFATWILLEVHRKPDVQAIPNLETQLPEHHSAPKLQVLSSTLTSPSKASPFSMEGSHPRLQRMSSTPALHSFAGQSLPSPTPRLAPSSIAAVYPPTRANLHRQSCLYCPTSKPNRVATDTTSSQSLQHKSSSFSTCTNEALPLSRGARMASVRRAPSTRSFGSGSTRGSRLQIMETVNEPEDGEEDPIENNTPTVRAIDVSCLESQGSCRDDGSSYGSTRPVIRSTAYTNVKLCKGKPSGASRNIECGRYSGEMQPHLLNLSNLDLNDRPLPPLPLLITKRIFVNQALHMMPRPQRAQSQVSKTAHPELTDADITKRRRMLQHRESQRANDRCNIQDLKQRGEHYHDRIQTRSAAHGRETLDLSLDLEDRDLFRLSLMHEILVVGR